eukprot:2621197-Amphidinium_carterae.1
MAEGRNSKGRGLRILKGCYPLTGAHAHLRLHEVRTVTRDELLELQTQWENSCSPVDVKPAYLL